MVHSFKFSEKSDKLIDDIVKQVLQKFPSITVSRQKNSMYYYINGKFCNRFDFYPTTNGGIQSISIYGLALLNHKQDIEKSGVFFNLKVSSITYETDGLEDFVDINIEFNPDLEGNVINKVPFWV